MPLPFRSSTARWSSAQTESLCWLEFVRIRRARDELGEMCCAIDSQVDQTFLIEVLFIFMAPRFLGAVHHEHYFADIQFKYSPHKRSVMAKKIDPLNKKLYSPVTAMLTVTDVKAAADFYQKAFGFAKRGIMNGPDGKAIHAELTLRGTTLMLGPEMPQMGSRAAKSIGASPTSLYMLTENVDKTVAKAVKLGAALKGQVMDMFWGDRCGTVVDPEGYNWMIATHVAELTPKEMQLKMKEQMASQQAAHAASGS
jgi:PhnB protein